MQRVCDVDVEAGGAGQRAGVVEHPIARDDDPVGAPGGVDDAVPAAERLAPHHLVQHGRHPLAVVGVLVLQQQLRAGLHLPGPVAVHARHRVRPLPAVAVQEEPEPADALRLTQAQHPLDRAEVAVALDDVRAERLRTRDGFVVGVHCHGRPIPSMQPAGRS